MSVGKETDHEAVHHILLAHHYFTYFGINFFYFLLMFFVLFNGYGFHTQLFDFKPVKNSVIIEKVSPKLDGLLF
jgi:hypothetical protein